MDTVAAPVAGAEVVVATDSLTGRLLQRYNLAPLWANRVAAGAEGDAPPMEGFFGPKHYRISFYFSDVRPDTLRPDVFHVTGLNRYQQDVVPLEGTVEVQQILPFTEPMARPAAAPTYTAVARFQLQTEPIGEAGGTFAGRAFLDFYLNARGEPVQLRLPYGAADANPTKGTGLLFRGDWMGRSGKRRQNVAFANDYAAVLPEALADLNMSNRDEKVNPILAQLGWDERWQNDKWWRAPIASPFNL